MGNVITGDVISILLRRWPKTSSLRCWRLYCSITRRTFPLPASPRSWAPWQQSSTSSRWDVDPLSSGVNRLLGGLRLVFNAVAKASVVFNPGSELFYVAWAKQFSCSLTRFSSFSLIWIQTQLIRIFHVARTSSPKKSRKSSTRCSSARSRWSTRTSKSFPNTERTSSCCCRCALVPPKRRPRDKPWRVAARSWSVAAPSLIPHFGRSLLRKTFGGSTVCVVASWSAVRVGRLAFLRPNCENSAVFRCALAAIFCLAFFEWF